MSFRILLVGGGTGGHVFPLIAVARVLQEVAARESKQIDLILLGEGKFFEEAARESGLPYQTIIAGKMRRYFSSEVVLDYLKMFAGFFQSFWHMFWIMPDAVFAKGGYVSFFPALAARFFSIPVYIHDSDTVPGKTSITIGKWAKKVFISFEPAKQYFPASRTELVGNPVRPELLNGDREEALLFFKLSAQSPTVLISGGSQGAKKINDIVLQSLIQLTKNFQVIHQCGEQNLTEVTSALEQLMKEGGEDFAEQIRGRYKIYPFFNIRELSLAYAVSDVIVSRSGSGSLFEIAALGKPGIVIPIKDSASNHQYYNALEFVKYGGTMIEEDNLMASIFINQIEEAYQRKRELGQTLRNFARLDAAEKIAAGILERV